MASINSFLNNYRLFPAICRICFLAVKNKLDTICINSIKLNEQETSLRNKLYFCCPELDLRIHSKATLCVNCFETINTIYKFTWRYDKSKRQLHEYFTFKFPTTQNFYLFEKYGFSGKCEIKSEEVDLCDTENDTSNKHTQIQSVIKPFQGLQNTDEKPFKCSVCNYSTTIKSHLKRHLCIHSGEKRFKCNYCDFNCTQSSNLKRHFRTHTGEKPFKCSVCNYCYTTKSSLKNHMHIHSGEKLYNCSHCNFNCIQKSNLKRHLSKHTGEKPFKCPVCSYSSSDKHNYKIHLCIHSGEKPFKCNYCAFNCTQSSNLKKHLRIHTGEKPFKCSMCDYCSTTKNHLKNHMHIHSGEKLF